MVDIVVGPQAYHRLPELVAEAARGGRAGRHRHAGDLPSSARCRARRRPAPSAFLTVQEGCDKFCTYCVVPYTRGAEISRPWSDIVDEAQALVDAGAREITLLGQNVNAWARRTAAASPTLIRALAALDGLERIRYTTSHPDDMTEGADRAPMREVDKLMPFLHLPVQSGSDRVLKAMNRSHTRRQLSRDHRAGPRRPARHRASRATSSSASPARPRPSSRRRCRSSTR